MKLSSTEKQNPISTDLDTKSVKEILKIINHEDAKVANSISKILPEIEKTINFAIETIKNGRSIFYVGAGTSGRLGVLDAAECVPTFSVPENYFQGIIAGGNDALIKSIENSEDDILAAEKDLKKAKVSVLNSLQKFLPLYKRRPNAFLIQTFFDAKSDEIVDIFSQGPQIEIKQTIKTLNKIAPYFGPKWKKIRS